MIVRSCDILKTSFQQGLQSPNLKIRIRRSSHRRCSIKNDVLEKFAKFTGKHLHQCPFLNEIADFRPNQRVFVWHYSNSSNSQEVFISEVTVLKSFTKVPGKHPWQCSCNFVGSLQANAKKGFISGIFLIYLWRY